MSIIYRNADQIFHLKTKNTSYVLCVSDFNALEHLYYGKRIEDDNVKYISNRQIYAHHAHESRTDRKFSMSSVGLEISPFGCGDFRVPSVAYDYHNQLDANRLRYQSHSIYQGRNPIEGLPYSRACKNTETLEIVLSDDDKQVEVKLYYVVFEDTDVIARHQTIENKGGESLTIQKCASACVDFYGHDFDTVTLEGMYLYEKAQVSRASLKRGTFVNNSLTGTSSHNHTPFIALCTHNADEDLGEVYGFNMLYSGNFKEEVSVSNLGDTRVLLGIDDTAFCWTLNKGERFYAPEVIMTYSDAGFGGMSRNFHDHIRASIIEQEFVYAPRPIVINSWEPFTFGVTEEKLLSLAEAAKDCGVDTVVLDDGWFRDRVQDGIGDWKTDKAKFPSGLKALSEKIHAMGFKFGIWFEPEMLAPASDLYKEHPDYALSTSKLPLISRHEYALDLTRDEVVEYVVNRICEDLEGVKVDYLKWDYNRYLTEAASTVTAQGEVYHRQMLGGYKLWEGVKKRLGNVFFESCSGGGGRFDLGMLFYSPQVWTSDNTDPYARAYIQYGTSYAYPLSSISCHFSEGKCTSGRPSTYEFRYNVANFGPYGYELDLAKYTAEDRALFKKYSEGYRAEEDLTLRGDLYRLISPETDQFCAYMKVAKDKSKVKLTFLELNALGFTETMVLRLKGLAPDKAYRNETTGETYYGATLMNVGIRIGDLFGKRRSDGYAVLFTAVEK